MSEWPKTNGPLKLSLFNSGGVGAGCGEGACYGTLPKSLPRCVDPSEYSYRTLPKNAVNGGGGYEFSGCGTLNRLISARNANATNSPRDSPTPAARNGVVSFRSDVGQHAGHWSPHKVNPENKVRTCRDRAPTPTLTMAIPQDAKHVWYGQMPRREELLNRSDDALAVLLVKLDQLAAQCDRAQSQGGGHHINQERFQVGPR